MNATEIMIINSLFLISNLFIGIILYRKSGNEMRKQEA